MGTSNAIALPAPSADFRDYLERSLRDPFTLDLSGLSLMDVVNACARAKSKMHKNYAAQIGGLKHNLRLLEEQFRTTLQPIQVTDIFWGYFDVDTFYRDRRREYRETMRRVRDMFVLSCNLFQRHSDMVRIGPECFERNIFRIVQQKTGNVAVVDIDRFSIEPKTTYRILKDYGCRAPYRADIGNYNGHLHNLMKDIGLDDPVRVEERTADGRMVSESVPKWQLISSHTARRTAITVNVLRGRNVHDLKRCSGHSDLRVFDNYVRDDK